MLVEYDKRNTKYHATDGKKDYSSLFPDTKNFMWYKDEADRYISAFGVGNHIEHKNYRKYRGRRDKAEFDRILGMYGDKNFGMPVPDIPHVPLIRRYIDYLVASNGKRPFVYNINYADPEAVQDKDNKLVAEVTKNIMQVLLQTMQSEMQGKDEATAKLEMEEKVAEIIASIPNFRTIQERVADKLQRTAIDRLGVLPKLSDCFLDKCITGKEYYRCRLTRVGELPEFDSVNPVDIGFSAEEVNSLNECSFVVYRKYLSITDIYSAYGHLFTENDKSNIKGWEDTWATANMANMSDYVPNYDEEFGYLGASERNLIEVFEVEWKTNKKVPVEELNGKFEILTQDRVLEEGFDESKVKYKYYQVLHTCTRINGDIYVKWGEVKYARRHPHNVSKVLLTFNGKLYNNKNNPPQSLVKDLSDLQDRYDILWYKMFEMLMLSGNKGSVLIEELLPPDMTPEEWMFWRKLGIARLSVSGEGVNPELINQIGQSLTAYDDTLPANGLQSVLALLAQIEKTVGDICGVPPQMLGQVQQYEAKANVESSITQGSITVEKIHQHHQEFCKEALNDILHWSKVGMSDGQLRDYILTPAEKELTKDLDVSWLDLNVMIVDGYKEEKDLQTAKQMVSDLVKVQGATFDTMVKSLKSGSLNELDNIVTLAIKNMQKKQQQSQQAELQAKQQESQSKLQLEQAKMQQEMQIKQLELQQEQLNSVQDDKIQEGELAIKDRLASVEEKYVEIAEKELTSGIESSNRKLDSREGRNKK